MNKEKRQVKIDSDDNTSQDETRIDPEEIMESEPRSEDLAALEVEIERLKQDAAESHDRYLRTLADFDNFRRRQKEETTRMADNAREDIILKLLTVIDNFERGVKAAEEQHSYEALSEGVALTLRQLTDLLTKEGLEPIESVGQEFNPELHEALASVETDEYPDHTVIDEYEKGYTLKGRVVRPARVRVAVGR